MKCIVKKRRIALPLALTLTAVVLLLPGCSGGTSSNSGGSDSAAQTAPAGDYYYRDRGELELAAADVYSQEEMAYDEAEAAPRMDDAGAELSQELSGSAAPTQRKIIQTVSLTLQTLAFDQTVREIEQAALAAGGYVENSSVDGLDLYSEYGSRRAVFTVRIPAEFLSGYVGELGEKYNVTSKELSTEDVTEQYFDLEARLQSLRIQQERLTAMLEDSTELKYMLEVERELSDVLYQIERYTSSLRRLENSVSLSTVHLYVYEVAEYREVENVPVTFGERAATTAASTWTGFVMGLQSFVLGLISALPTLIILAILAVLVLLTLRKLRPRLALRHRERKENSPPPPPWMPGPYGQIPPSPIDSQTPEEDTSNDTPDRD